MIIRRYLLLLTILAAPIALLALRPSDPDAATLLHARYLRGLDGLRTELVALRAAAGSIGGEADLASLRERFAAARRAYKEIELYVEYADRYAAWKLNGVPLPKVDETVAARWVIAPEGFQVIEEMLYGEEALASGEEIARLAGKMIGVIDRTRPIVERQPLSDRQLLEAARDQLLRLVSLGLAGFDVPGSENALAECRWALAGIGGVADAYMPALERRRPDLASTIGDLMENGERLLGSAPSFEELDRVTFIREVASPLFAALRDARAALGIERASESVRYNRALNEDADDLFAPDLVNPWFFSPDPHDQEIPARIELGRRLFFDPLLSGNGSRSCASCHRPELAFTDGLARSTSFHGDGSLRRNSPTLLNSVFQQGLFHDRRAGSFEEQIEMVLLNGDEMRTTMEELTRRIDGKAEYGDLFAKAYPAAPDVSGVGITRAIASYLRSLVALDSPFDRYMRRESDSIDPAVLRGFNLFMGKGGCGTCHFAPLFNGTVPPLYTDTDVEVLGTTAGEDLAHPVLDDDPGRFAFAADSIHLHAFKTPTLRNVVLTAPYMHNGSFGSLERVVEFYNAGGGAGLGLTVPNQTLPSDSLGLTPSEIADIVAFMKALTDTVVTPGPGPARSRR